MYKRQDGIQARNDEEEAKGYVEISDGTFAITAGAKGIKAVTRLEISGGTIDIDSEDDAIHSNGDVNITGGTFTIATGDDGIHADNRVAVSYTHLDVYKRQAVGKGFLTVSTV